MDASKRSETPLDEIATGAPKRVSSYKSGGGSDAGVQVRLAELGLVPGASVAIERRTLSNDPALRFCNSLVAVRREAAHNILVSACSSSCAENLCGTAKAAPPAAVPVVAASEAAPPAGGLRVCFAAVANAGKTTCWNALTGINQHVSNYPGTTVEIRTERIKVGGEDALLADLPGLGSLVPRSKDESVTLETLCGQMEGFAPNCVVALVDATRLRQSLFLVSQIAELGLPLVVALTKTDEATDRDMCADADALARKLSDVLGGIPVVPVVVSQGRGLRELISTLPHARRAVGPFPWEAKPADSAVEEAIKSFSGKGVSEGQARAMARALVYSPEVFGSAAGVRSARASAPAAARTTDALLRDTESRYAWIDAFIAATGTRTSGKRLPRDRIDDVLLHPVAGLLVFASVMVAFFCAVFVVGDALKGAVEDGIAAAGEALAPLWGSPLLQDMWLNGIIAGVTPVLSFLPQVVLVFTLQSVLDGSGYLARGAFMLDRVLSAVGLHGRSFVPLVMSHGCALPGIMAARTIPDWSERLATMFVAPFMACPARLPVYTLLVGTCFSWLSPLQKGLVMAGLYFAGIVIAAVVAWTLRHTPAAGGEGSSFYIELPTYQWPDWREMVRCALQAAKTFLVRAGTVILIFSVVLWAAMTFPRIELTPEQSGLSAAAAQGDANAVQALLHLKQVQLEQSIAGKLGHLVEPILAPAGMDWRIGVGLLGAFAAREAFTSTLAMVYGVEAGDDSGLEERLLSATRPDGTPVWSPLLAVSVLAWFALAMQCFSTVVVMAKETGWRWALVQAVIMNALAWVAAVLIWQVGCIIWP